MTLSLYHTRILVRGALQEDTGINLECQMSPRYLPKTMSMDLTPSGSQRLIFSGQHSTLYNFFKDSYDDHTVQYILLLYNVLHQLPTTCTPVAFPGISAAVSSSSSAVLRDTTPPTPGGDDEVPPPPRRGCSVSHPFQGASGLSTSSPSYS